MFWKEAYMFAIEKAKGVSHTKFKEGKEAKRQEEGMRANRCRGGQRGG